MNKSFNKAAEYLNIFAALALSLFALYTATTGVKTDMVQRGVVLFLVLVMVFTKQMMKENLKWYMKIILVLLLLLSSWSILYQVVNYRKVAVSMGSVTTYELILGIILIVSLLIATKLSVGWPIVIISVLFILYARYGYIFSGSLGHRGYKWTRIVSHMVTNTSGIFGTPLGTASTMVVSFIVFGAFLEASGGASFFMDLAIALTGKSKGGPAKAAVVSSALMGTISGNAASNVVTTGTFTIPLMKRIGYDSHVAGAVEAVASTGGQIMPPVMGAAAFIMAELIGQPYGTIALAAVIPSVLYYISVFFMVHFEAVKKDVQCMETSEIPNLKETFRLNWHTLLSIIVLVTTLIMGFSAVKAALFGTVTAIVCSYFRKHTRITPVKFYKALLSAGRAVVTVGIACGCAGLIIGSVSLTGLGLKISSMIISASGGHLIIALILTFIALFILGMGMPTAAAYIMVATLVAPGLVEMGLTRIGAHMFCLYGAVLSAITPPVALAAYAASGIAKANPMKIGFTAIKFGIVAFIVPFFFAYQPALLWIGDTGEIVLSIVTAIIGVILLSAGIQGYGICPVQWPFRILAIGGALLMMYPGVATDLIGLGICLIVVISQIITRRRLKTKSTTEAEPL